MDNGQGGTGAMMAPPMGSRVPFEGQAAQGQPLQPGQPAPAMNTAPVPPAQQAQGSPPWLAQQQAAALPPLDPSIVEQIKVGLQHSAPVSEILSYFGVYGTTEAHVHAIAREMGLDLDASDAATASEEPGPNEQAKQEAQAKTEPGVIPDDAQLEAMDRDDLKELGEGHGLWDSSCRYGAPRMVKELAEHRDSGRPSAEQETAEEAPAPASGPKQLSIGDVIEGDGSELPDDPRVQYVRDNPELDLRFDASKKGYEVVAKRAAAKPVKSVAVPTTPQAAPLAASVSRVGFACQNVDHLARQAGLSYQEIATAAQALAVAETE